MVAVLAAASYSRGGFIPCLAVSARPVMVPGGSTFHLEHGTLGGGGIPRTPATRKIWGQAP